MKTKLTQRIVKAAVSKDALRPSMQGVYHDAEVHRLVATDGAMMIAWPYEGQTDEPAGIIPVKAFPIKRPDEHELLLDKGFVTTKNGATESRNPLIDERYPDYKSVVPDLADPVLTVGFDLAVLKRIHDAIPGSNKMVILRFFAPNRAAYITPMPPSQYGEEDHDTFIFALAMPAHIEDPTRR